MFLNTIRFPAFSDDTNIPAKEFGQQKNPLNRVNQVLNMEKKGWKEKLRAMGIAGFLFFLIKGILWLVIGAGAFKTCM